MKPFVLGIALSLCFASALSAQIFGGRFNRVAPDGSITLPFAQTDAAGNQWIIFPGGSIRQQPLPGVQAIYGQAESLVVNNAVPGMNANFARIDSNTGELVISGMNGAGCTVTRRILVNSPDGFIRYIDVIKNPQAQDQTVNLQLQTNLNFGVTGSSIIVDPHRKENQIGWVAMTGANRAAVEIYAGKGAKLVPAINCDQGNTVVQTTYQLEVKAGKSVAIVHLLGSAGSIEQGADSIMAFKESKLLASLPADVRRIVVNFTTAGSVVGDYEILRGDAFDVIELRSGDQLHGTIKEDAFKLNTFYGQLSLPTDQVVAMMNVGQYRPRQLLVTSDGQVFGGTLDAQTISMELSSGQVVQVPLGEITRLGYHKRPDEPDEWNFDKPTVIMRSGDRVFVDLPTAPIDVLTRYGELKLDPQSIGSILFQTDDTGVHEILMSDGSRFAGLAEAPEFEMKLTSPFAAQPVKFPASSLVSIQFAAKVADADDTTPSLLLLNQDSLIGTLVGALKLDTAFDTIEINAPEIRKIVHPTAGTPDVQVTLWDNTVVSGVLEEQDVQCDLLCGAQINVPVSLLAEYNQPLPRPSAPVIDKIKSLAADLSADDWKQRDEAESSLEAIGPSVISVLRDLRRANPPRPRSASTRSQNRFPSAPTRLPSPPPTARKPPMPEANFNDIFTTGVAHHEAGRLREAEEHYRRVIAANPKHDQAHAMLAVIASQSGRFDDAIELILQAITLAPDRAEHHYNHGLILAEADRPDDAMTAYRRALAADPALAPAHYNLGNLLSNKQRYSEAADSFRLRWPCSLAGPTP